MFKTTSTKNKIAFLIDACIILFVSFLGMYLRLGFSLFEKSYLAHQSAIFTATTLIVFWLSNIHRGIWRYFNFNYLIDITKASTYSIMIFLFVSFIDSRLEGLPRSVIIINWLLLVILISSPRILYKSYKDGGFKNIFKTKYVNPSPILVAGICSATENFIRELKRIENAPYKVIGILDERANLGRIVNGVPIMGTIDDIEEIYDLLKKKNQTPIRLLISSELHLGGRLKFITNIAEKLSLPISRIPKLTEVFHNFTQTLPIQPIAIEDLLRRPQRPVDLGLTKSLIEGKRVLITGAGGSIGSEITRQVAALMPQSICIMDLSEFLLFEIEQDCQTFNLEIIKNTVLADIKDRNLIMEIFNREKPDIIFHAAALKHVPLLEKHKIEAIQTNILGTKNVIDAAISVGCEKFVMISTDKAVDPSSFMGASKKIAELYCQSIVSQKTQISIVRFGNVLGSNGSVVPIFEKQIIRGGPITITSDEATRYFMTIKEAVGLVIQAAALKESSNVKVFVLDMGEPIKIIDLAKHMIMLAGLKLDVDISINVIGLRPGEKLHEILITEHEALVKTTHESIFSINPKTFKFDELEEMLLRLKELCEKRDTINCQELIANIIKKIS